MKSFFKTAILGTILLVSTSTTFGQINSEEQYNPVAPTDGIGYLNLDQGTNVNRAKIQIFDGTLSSSHRSNIKIITGADQARIEFWPDANYAAYMGEQKMVLGFPNNNYDLFVNGEINAYAVHIKIQNWWDDVFAPNYKLRSINELEAFINKNNHLPGILPEKEVLENGIELGEFNSNLLRNVEELTLYIVQLNKDIESLQKEINSLKNVNNER